MQRFWANLKIFLTQFVEYCIILSIRRRNIMDPTNEHENTSAISSDLIRGHINTIILRTLYDGDKYGYEIINEIEEKSKGQYSLKQPTLYSALKRLEGQDYVTSYWGGVSNGGRRKYFQITDKGKKVVEQNLAEWEYSRTVIDSLISEKDFDFSNPPPSAVDFSLLKKSTTRISTSGADLDHDDIDLGTFQRPQAEDQPEPIHENVKEQVQSPIAEAETAADPSAEKIVSTFQEDAVSEGSAEELQKAEEPPVSAAAQTESTSTRVSDAPAFARTDDTDENGERTKPFGGAPTWVDEEQRRIQHENYRNLVGDDDDASSFYYEQVTKNNRTETARAIADSRSSSTFESPSYYREDAYDDERADSYRQNYGAYGEDGQGDAFLENRAISSELLYSNRSPAERNYKDLLSRLYDNSARQSYYPDSEENYYPEEEYREAIQDSAPPQQDPAAAPAEESKQPAEFSEATSASNVEFYDMEERAESDGIRIMTSNGARNRTPGKAVGNVFDKGRTLFMCALCVFVIALVECIVNLCIRNVIHSNVAYVIIPFCCAFVMFGIFLFLYLRGFGKNSRKSQSRSYLSASLILFADLVVIICLIAWILIANSATGVTFIQILKYGILPCIFIFNIPLFAIFYNYFSNRQ